MQLGRRLLLVLACLLACVQPDPYLPGPPVVSLVVDSASVPRGGSFDVQLYNVGLPHAGYNLCMTEVQVFEGGHWLEHDGAFHRTHGSGHGIVCTSELRVLEPGGSASYTFHLADDVVPATYRLKGEFVGVARQQAHATAFSNGFLVE